MIEMGEKSICEIGVDILICSAIININNIID